MREGVEVDGDVVGIGAPKRIVFPWGWVGDDAVAPGSTRVEVTLSPDGQSGTDVVLRHYGLPDAVQVEHHKQGWEQYLGRLVVTATRGDPGLDPNA